MNDTGNDNQVIEATTDSIDLKELTILMAKLDTADRQLILDFAKQLHKVGS